LRETLGFDARQLTPTAVLKITVLAAETRSFNRAEKTARSVAELEVSAKTIERVVHDVGRELEERRDASTRRGDPLARRPVEPPDLAVVECDGGRIRTREPGHGPGVHRSGEGWREDKNACLIRAKSLVFSEDPQPEPPRCFCDPKHTAKIAETEALSVAALLPDVRESVREDGLADLHVDDWRPKRLVRTVLSSVANSQRFGRQMAREAKQRRFDEASSKAFLGDGLAWNWSIWKEHFSDFTPILDFTHALSYLYVVAKAIHAHPEDAWEQYLVWMHGCWRGEVGQVLEELRLWQGRLGAAPPDVPEHDSRCLVAKTITYLDHNKGRMNYPEYRRKGMPVTTAWMESLVKEINYRAKGTEMFWNDPQGAEAILQVRAAALCDDDRLVEHLKTRPGHPLTRRPKAPRLPAQKRKS
jgi:hypothetical protein